MTFSPRTVKSIIKSWSELAIHFCNKTSRVGYLANHSFRKVDLQRLRAGRVESARPRLLERYIRVPAA